MPLTLGDNVDPMVAHLSKETRRTSVTVSVLPFFLIIGHVDVIYTITCFGKLVHSR